MNSQSIGIKLVSLTLLVLSPGIYFNFIYDRDIGYNSLNDKADALMIAKTETKEISNENDIIQSENQSLNNFEKNSNSQSDITVEQTAPQQLFNFIKIVHSCNAFYGGNKCVVGRNKPDNTSPVSYKFRNGVVLKIKDKVFVGGKAWYKVVFDEWLLYPNRMKPDVYVPASFADDFEDIGIATTQPTSTTTRRILVSLSKQMLYANEGDTLYMSSKVSTGLDSTPSPVGTFTIFRKTPTRYMQGSEEAGDGYYDLPGVPWDMYFTGDGAAIHGAYWHQNFGHRHSHGCINLPLDAAEQIYRWADVGTKVTIVE